MDMNIIFLLSAVLAKSLVIVTASDPERRLVLIRGKYVRVVDKNLTKDSDKVTEKLTFKDGLLYFDGEKFKLARKEKDDAVVPCDDSGTSECSSKNTTWRLSKELWTNKVQISTENGLCMEYSSSEYNDIPGYPLKTKKCSISEPKQEFQVIEMDVADRSVAQTNPQERSMFQTQTYRYTRPVTYSTQTYTHTPYYFF